MTTSPSAQEKAQQTAATAADESKQVAGTAKQEAQNVAAEAKDAGHAACSTTPPARCPSSRAPSATGWSARCTPSATTSSRWPSQSGASGVAADLVRQVVAADPHHRRARGRPRAGRAARRRPGLRPPPPGHVPARRPGRRCRRGSADPRRQGRQGRLRRPPASAPGVDDRHHGAVRGVASAARRSRRCRPARRRRTALPAVATPGEPVTGVRTGRGPARRPAGGPRPSRAPRTTSGDGTRDEPHLRRRASTRRSPATDAASARSSATSAPTSPR